MKKKNSNNNNTDFETIILLIQQARSRAFAKVNEEPVMLYYNVGGAISQKVKAGAWGEGTVDELVKYIGFKIPGLRGFNRRGIYRMKQFYEAYSIEEFISPVATYLKTYLNNTSKSKKVSAMPTLLKASKGKNKIAWSNHLEIPSQTKSSEEKLYYLILCIKERRSMRELRCQIQSADFERAMIGNQIASAAIQQIPEGFFKDSYIFEFLDLPDIHSEKDLEKALIQNLQKFMLEIGKGFIYMGRQFRLQVDNKDYFTDLLFFHRDLQCLVLFELKIQEFEPEFLGKLNFYLEALDRDVKRPHEKPSVGVLLCKGKDNEVVEYAMARNTSPAMIADYETKLIPKKLLANKLHQLAEQLSIKNI